MLTKLEIKSREPVLDGKSFGAVGPYEALLGSAQFAVDPNHVLNQPIADLGLVPVDAQGRVTFRADVYLLKPVVPSRGNGNVFYHVVNRGRKNLLTVFNLAGSAQFGDEFLMREGYVVAACGWQSDVPPEAPDNPDLMTLDVPVIHGMTGPVGCEIVVDNRVEEHSLGSRYHIPYEVADENDPNAVLTVRAYPYDEPEVIARDRWSLGRLADGRPSIRFSEGFEPGLIYNLVYTGKDPCVMGLGLAATRDFLSFLKYEEREENPLCEGLGALPIERVYSFGSSQSGRFLRHLLYLGFNQDEAGRQVMDGVMANVAGGARGSFNHRFAQPSRHSSGHTDVFYPTEQFPFNDLPQSDSVTGETGGLLDRCEAQGVTPHIFYTNTSTEYWNRGASLVHTDVGGTQDVVLPECVRVYHFASTQHGPGEVPAGARETWPPNPVNFRYALRALLVAMDAWVREGKAPPESRYGSISEGTLVRAAAVSFPKIPEVDLLKRMRVPLRLNHGDSWKEGTISKEPPDLGAPYGVLVPALDTDGNEVTGIRMPEELVPLGTFTGWRFRPANHGASDAMVGLAGMWVPFARTEVEREASADSRPSVEARYANQEAYVGRVARAALELVEARLILPQDVTQVLRRAEKMYTWVMEEGITS